MAGQDQERLATRELDSLSTPELRQRARALVHGALRIRFHRNWKHRAGNDGFVVFDAQRNVQLTEEPLDADRLRAYLLYYLSE